MNDSLVEDRETRREMESEQLMIRQLLSYLISNDSRYGGLDIYVQGKPRCCLLGFGGRWLRNIFQGFMIITVFVVDQFHNYLLPSGS